MSTTIRVLLGMIKAVDLHCTDCSAEAKRLCDRFQLDTKKKAIVITNIDEDTRIESNFVCSKKHRAFFKENIGNSFSFNVSFQK